MDLDCLIDGLSHPTAYSHPAAPVEIRHTHISVVFLAGPYAYKVKKPVDFGFLDFREPGQRKFFCEEEVRLNRRLAPEVYLGVVPVTWDGATLRMDGAGEAVEWAVKMQRLPEGMTLQARLGRGEGTPALVEELARRLASFHAAGRSDERVAAWARFEPVAANARDNFAQSADQVGCTVSQRVFERLRLLTEEALARLRPLIAARAERGVPRDAHGDLHLDHVYYLPERQPPGDLVIVDCIEFAERFRCADPVADIAFLVMDFRFHGREELAAIFVDAYFRAAADEEGRFLLPFYSAYRAAVRGKVEGLKTAEREVPAEERERARTRARAHWLLALSELEEPARRPCLVVVAGLQGTGKSTLGRGLAAHAGLQVIRSDVVRKELAGASVLAETLYTPEWTERTYAECLRRAEALLFDGERVLLDATFREEAHRARFLEAGRRWAVPVLFLLCRADPEIIRGRLAGRRNDVSDADWAVYEEAARRWETPGPETRRMLHEISANGTPEETLEKGLAQLRAAGIL
jgi:aminoglycoside phosphotransferase family enzyme/predicted kinase